jgi:ABC-2 type transport system ATP-binding protein
MAAVIETRNLAKNYGNIQALRGVTLAVEQGNIYGLLGQNGAGKTTLIKILLGVATGWEGEARLLGEEAGNVPIRKRVGYLPEDHRFPDYHTAYSLLDFYGTLLEMPRPERQKRIPEYLEMVGLKARMHYKIRTYSKGMKQRVGIAQALVHDPAVIFLDEPTDGVDPVGRREIREILLRLREEGKTIFINSHLLGEVELVCDRVAILQRGEVIREGDIESLTRQVGRYTIRLAAGQAFPDKELAQMGYKLRRTDEDTWQLELEKDQKIDAVLDLLRSRNLSIVHMSESRQTLEDLFLETVDAAEPGVDRRDRRDRRDRDDRRDRGDRYDRDDDRVRRPDDRYRR